METPSAETRFAQPGGESLADWMTTEEVLVNLQALSDVIEAQETELYTPGEATTELSSPPQEKWTLFLDIDETLVHVTPYPDPDVEPDISFVLQEEAELLDPAGPFCGAGHGGSPPSAVLHVYYRPFLFTFLDKLAETSRFELVAYTAALPQYADPILDSIENKRMKRGCVCSESEGKKLFAARLYRHHCSTAKRKTNQESRAACSLELRSVVPESKGEQMHATYKWVRSSKEQVPKYSPSYECTTSASCEGLAEGEGVREDLTPTVLTNASSHLLCITAPLRPLQETGETVSVSPNNHPLVVEGSSLASLDENEGVEEATVSLEEHEEEEEIFYVKDLRYAAPMRSLSRCLLLDNSPVSFAAQLANGLLLKPFFGSPDDRELEAVLNVLLQISDCDDVREGLRNKSMLDRVCRAIQVYPEEVTKFFTLPECVREKLLLAGKNDLGHPQEGHGGQQDCEDVSGVEDSVKESKCLVETAGKQRTNELNKTKSASGETGREEKTRQRQIEEERVRLAANLPYDEQRQEVVVLSGIAHVPHSYSVNKGLIEEAPEAETNIDEHARILEMPENGRQCFKVESEVVLAPEGHTCFPVMASNNRELLHIPDATVLSPRVSLILGDGSSGLMKVKTEWKEDSEIWILTEPPSTRAGTDTPSSVSTTTIRRSRNGDAVWYTGRGVSLRSLDGSPFRACSLSGDWSFFPSSFGPLSPVESSPVFRLPSARYPSRSPLPIAATSLLRACSIRSREELSAKELSPVQRANVAEGIVCSGQPQETGDCSALMECVPESNENGELQASPCCEEERNAAVTNWEVQHRTDKSLESRTDEDVQDTNRAARLSVDTSTPDELAAEKEEEQRMNAIEVKSSPGCATNCYRRYRTQYYALGNTLHPVGEFAFKHGTVLRRDRNHEGKEQESVVSLRKPSTVSARARRIPAANREAGVQGEPRTRRSTVRADRLGPPSCTREISVYCDMRTQGPSLSPFIATHTPICCPVPATIFIPEKDRQQGVSGSWGTEPFPREKEEVVRQRNVKPTSPSGWWCRSRYDNPVSPGDWQSGSADEQALRKGNAVLVSGGGPVVNAASAHMDSASQFRAAKREEDDRGEALENARGYIPEASSPLVGGKFIPTPKHSAHSTARGRHSRDVYFNNFGSFLTRRGGQSDAVRLLADSGGNCVAFELPQVYSGKEGSLISVAARANTQDVSRSTALLFGASNECYEKHERPVRSRNSQVREEEKREGKQTHDNHNRERKEERSGGVAFALREPIAGKSTRSSFIAFTADREGKGNRSYYPVPPDLNPRCRLSCSSSDLASTCAFCHQEKVSHLSSSACWRCTAVGASLHAAPSFNSRRTHYSCISSPPSPPLPLCASSSAASSYASRTHCVRYSRQVTLHLHEPLRDRSRPRQHRRPLSSLSNACQHTEEAAASGVPALGRDKKPTERITPSVWEPCGPLPLLP
ncbi:nli interacting factor family phosphatase [Cystoisospora suis]|uniref:Nli interacting factor family phosphatase n=1 Tax=Cystoisospora suis TaxID=483139 RepID=A0A2C6LH32_9APIC|nr:nli interacting factor family phosphatase [Cystoisospora suis]